MTNVLRVAALLASVATATPVGAALAIVEVAPGIYRGPAPETAADYRQLRDFGINSVIDLRKFRQRQREQHARCVAAHGMTYFHRPVSFRPERDGSAERAWRLLTSVQLYPIYIHCELGRDRSGLVIGLYRVRCQGWSLSCAYAEMKRFGFRSIFRGLDNYFWEHAR